MVYFDNLVIINETLIIDKNLQTNLLFNFNTTDWLNRAVFVNQGLLSGKLFI